MNPTRRQSLIVSALRSYPDATVREVAQRLNMDPLRVAGMLSHLEAYGVVQGVLPPLMTRGKRYRLVDGVVL